MRKLIFKQSAGWGVGQLLGAAILWGLMMLFSLIWGLSHRCISIFLVLRNWWLKCLWWLAQFHVLDLQAETPALPASLVRIWVGWRWPCQNTPKVNPYWTLYNTAQYWRQQKSSGARWRAPVAMLKSDWWEGKHINLNQDPEGLVRAP